MTFNGNFPECQVPSLHKALIRIVSLELAEIRDALKGRENSLNVKLLK